MADFGITEAAALDAMIEAAAAEAAAAGAVEAGAGYGAAAAGAGAAGLSAAELAAYEQMAQQGLLGAGELASLEGGSAGLLSGSGGTVADAQLFSGLDSLDKAGISNYTEGLLGQQSGGMGASTPYGAGDTMSIADQPGQGPGLLDKMKYEGMNALNKAGGQFNKLPAPVQGLLVSQAIPKPNAPQQASSYRPPQQQQFAQPMKPQVQPASYQAQPFATSSFGQNVDPQTLELIKKLKMQGRI